MAGHLVIAINREYGSGGKEVAEKLAERLGIPCYDDDITEMASQHSGIRRDYFEKVDENPTDSLLYMLAMNTHTVSASLNPFENILSSDKLFAKQAEVIRRLASEGDCIIIGRCAGYILREEEKCVKLYLSASADFRTNRIMASDGISEKEARKKMYAMDKRRDSYFGYYAGKDWRFCKTYDLSVDTSVLGIDKTVDFICQYLEMRFDLSFDDGKC